MPLTVPNNAPLSGPQRMWLKGFLDGVNSALDPAPAGGSNIATPTAEATGGSPVTILWGSQTGNSEQLGKKLAKALKAKGHQPTLKDMAETTATDLSEIENLLVITSTYGDGEPPDNAIALHTALHADDAPSLASVKFSVLALGDSNYASFCKCGRDFDQRLTALGAKPLAPIVECDVDFDDPFTSWSDQLLTALASA